MARTEMRSRYVSGYNSTASVSVVRQSLLQAKEYPAHACTSHSLENLVRRLHYLFPGLWFAHEAMLAFRHPHVWLVSDRSDCLLIRTFIVCGPMTSRTSEE